MPDDIQSSPSGEAIQPEILDQTDGIIAFNQTGNFPILFQSLRDSLNDGLIRCQRSAVEIARTVASKAELYEEVEKAAKTSLDDERAQFRKMGV